MISKTRNLVLFVTVAFSAVLGVSGAEKIASAQPASTLESVFVRDPAMLAMPIEQRPNRFGHVYGNNYRRLHHGRLFINRGRVSRPVASFFYR